MSPLAVRRCLVVVGQDACATSWMVLAASARGRGAAGDEVSLGVRIAFLSVWLRTILRGESAVRYDAV